MLSHESINRSISDDGFVVLERLVPEPVVAELTSALDHVHQEHAIQRRGRVHAIRNLLDAVPEVQDLAHFGSIRSVIEAVLGRAAFVARGILFDKTPEANWKVAWHQDLTIAVQEKGDAPGFGAWSEKAGIPHVQPPAEILERMLAVRVHLDYCGAESGPLQVIPGSHRSGRLDAVAISRWRESSPSALCTTGRGGVVLMRPLLLHASSPAEVPEHPPEAGLFGFYAAEYPVGDTGIQVVNVHLSPFLIPRGSSLADVMDALSDTENTHSAEVDAILDTIEPGGPTIVLGDFNSISTVNAPKRLVDHGFVDSFASVHSDADVHPTWRLPGRSFPVALRIDYLFHTTHFLFHTTHFETVHSEILACDGSDHSLLVSELTFGEEGFAPESR